MQYYWAANIQKHTDWLNSPEIGVASKHNHVTHPPGLPWYIHHSLHSSNPLVHFEDMDKVTPPILDSTFTLWGTLGINCFRPLLW